MIVRRYLAWMRTAPAEARAAATGALARAYLFSGMDPHERSEAEKALTLVLDDSAVMVRQALAEALAHAADAPRHLIAALADDESSVASIVLSRSTLLEEADLVDRVATGDALVQTAVAMRPEVPPAIAAAVAEVAEAEAVAALAANPAAQIPAFSMARIVERHGADPAVRNALMTRSDLPPEIRLAVVRAIAQDMASVRDGVRLPGTRGELAAGDAADKACLAVIVDSPDEDVPAMVDQLRRDGRLTPMLLLHAILRGDVRPLVATLVHLTRQKPERVRALVSAGHGPAFEALVRKAGLSASLLPVIEAALSARREVLAQEYPPSGPALLRTTAAMTLEGCRRRAVAGDSAIVTALRRIEADAAREEARLVADTLLVAQAGAAALPPCEANDDDEEPLLLGPSMLVGIAPERISAAPATADAFATAAALCVTEGLLRPSPDHAWTGTPVPAPVERLAMGAVAAALFAGAVLETDRAGEQAKAA